MCTWLAALAWTLRTSLSCKTKGWVNNSVVVFVAILFALNTSKVAAPRTTSTSTKVVEPESLQTKIFFIREVLDMD